MKHIHLGTPQVYLTKVHLCILTKSSFRGALPTSRRVHKVIEGLYVASEYPSP